MCRVRRLIKLGSVSSRSFPEILRRKLNCAFQERLGWNPACSLNKPNPRNQFPGESKIFNLHMQTNGHALWDRCQSRISEIVE